MGITPARIGHERKHREYAKTAYDDSQTYAGSKAGCYKTKGEAACWKEVATNYYPIERFLFNAQASVFQVDILDDFTINSLSIVLMMGSDLSKINF